MLVAPRAATLQALAAGADQTEPPTLISSPVTADAETLALKLVDSEQFQGSTSSEFSSSIKPAAGNKTDDGPPPATRDEDALRAAGSDDGDSHGAALSESAAIGRRIAARCG